MLCLMEGSTLVAIELSTKRFCDGLSCEGTGGLYSRYQRQKLFLSTRHCLALSTAASTQSVLSHQLLHTLLILLQYGTVFCIQLSQLDPQWISLQLPELLLQPLALSIMPHLVPAIDLGRLCPGLGSITHLVSCSNRSTDHCPCEGSIQD